MAQTAETRGTVSNRADLQREQAALPVRIDDEAQRGDVIALTALRARTEVPPVLIRAALRR